MYQSNEEKHFADWLDNLKKEGFVVDYTYEPAPFLLCDSISVKFKKENKSSSKCILRAMQYTTDFKVEWDIKSDGVFTYAEEGDYKKGDKTLIYRDDKNISYIEVKPEYDFNNMTRVVKTKIAWVYALTGTYVQIIKPYKLFRDTFYPYNYIYTDKSKKYRKIKVNGASVYAKDNCTFLSGYLMDYYKGKECDEHE